jgi:tetratricopeptide (TPR) repeat protein
MCDKKFHFLILLSVIAFFASRGLCADTAAQTFQDGLFLEYSTGDLEKAIESYEKVLRNGYADEELSAKTLLRLGICYERVSRDEDAKNAYQQIISSFPGQRNALDQAIKRLQKLSSGLVGDGYWFRYKGAHVYLIGAGTASIYAGSGLEPGKPVTDDPVRDWKAYIDLLIQHRINLVRFQPWNF